MKFSWLFLWALFLSPIQLIACSGTLDKIHSIAAGTLKLPDRTIRAWIATQRNPLLAPYTKVRISGLIEKPDGNLSQLNQLILFPSILVLKKRNQSLQIELMPKLLTLLYSENIPSAHLYILKLLEYEVKRQEALVKLSTEGKFVIESVTFALLTQPNFDYLIEGGLERIHTYLLLNESAPFRQSTPQALSLDMFNQVEISFALNWLSQFSSSVMTF